MALPHSLAFFLLSLPVTSPSSLLPHTPELPFKLTLGGSPNIELSSHPTHFFSAPTIFQTLESGSKPKKTWLLP